MGTAHFEVHSNLAVHIPVLGTFRETAVLLYNSLSMRSDVGY